MQTKAKSNSILTHSLSDDGHTLRFHVLGAGSVTLSLQALHADVKAQAVIHGMIQRVSDAAALGRDKETGRSASPQDKLDAMRRLCEHYNEGNSTWRLVVASGGGRDDSGITIEAVARVKGIDVGEAERRVGLAAESKGMERKEYLAILRKNSESIAKAILAIRSERIQPVADADKMLGEI